MYTKIKSLTDTIIATAIGLTHHANKANSINNKYKTLQLFEIDDWLWFY